MNHQVSVTNKIMSLLVLALLLPSVWATIVDHSQNQEFPPDLITYVLGMKELHCPSSNATILITLGKVHEKLRNQLLHTMVGTIMIGNEGLLFGKSIPKVDCGIILVNLYVSIFKITFVLLINNLLTDYVPWPCGDQF